MSKNDITIETINKINNKPTEKIHFNNAGTLNHDNAIKRKEFCITINEEIFKKFLIIARLETKTKNVKSYTYLENIITDIVNKYEEEHGKIVVYL